MSDWLRAQGDADVEYGVRGPSGGRLFGRRGRAGVIVSADPGLEAEPYWPVLCGDWAAAAEATAGMPLPVY